MKYNASSCIKRLATLSMVGWLAACTTVSYGPAQPGSPTAGSGGTVATSPSTATPAPGSVLSVPTQPLPDSPARNLAGRFVAADWSEMPGWQADELEQVWQAFLLNCQGLMRPISGGLTLPARATPPVWQPVCAAAQRQAQQPGAASTAQVRAFLQQHLRPWRLLDAGGKVATNTVTGYYEPLVVASRQRGGQFQWPLYAVPDDLLTIDLGGLYPELAGKRVRGKLDGKRVVPYDTRVQLQSAGRQPAAIVWVNDPVDAAFLQIQGSGRAYLADGPGAGSTIRLAYANHNGQPFQSIGRWLIQKGELTAGQASMQGIRAWARDNPHRVEEMLSVNPAVVFFREEAIADEAAGPKGAYSLPLTERRSIAVDTQFVPLGTPVFLSTTWPGDARPLNRLVFAQDTGAAIKGAARADFYWGYGEEAGNIAGRMKQNGRMWVLWPRAAGTPSAR